MYKNASQEFPWKQGNNNQQCLVNISKCKNVNIDQNIDVTLIEIFLNIIKISSWHYSLSI